MKLLGKLPAKIDHRTFQFADYLRLGQLPTPPDTLTNSKYVKSWGMMLNDTLGDCVVAGGGHYIKLCVDSTGKNWTVPDWRVHDTYFHLTGGQDTGLVELDFLNHWRKEGLFGHKIAAFTQIKTKNLDMTKLAMYMFSSAFIGLAMPLTAQYQKIWEVTKTSGDGKPGSWGGHCVILVDYNATGPVCVTWGGLLQMTWQFYQEYCEESYALLSGDWIQGTGKSVTGFDYSTLMSDLHSLAA